MDCYDCVVSAQEVKKAEANFKEKGVAGRSILPFGYGDGGGGPTAEQVERARRFADLEDAPSLPPAVAVQFTWTNGEITGLAEVEDLACAQQLWQPGLVGVRPPCDAAPLPSVGHACLVFLRNVLSSNKHIQPETKSWKNQP